MPVGRRRPRSNDGDRSSDSEREQARLEGRRRWMRMCRTTAKRRWRQMGVTGVGMLLLATALLCITAYLEKWHTNLDGLGGHSSPKNDAQEEDDDAPLYFADKLVPAAFRDYGAMHSRTMASSSLAKQAKYVLYDLPGKTSLSHALLGLTSTYLFALMSGRVLLVRWSSSDQNMPAVGAGNSSHVGLSSDDVFGANDVLGTGGSGSGEGSSSSGGGGGASGDEATTVDDLFLSPGFSWKWFDFVNHWTDDFGLSESLIQLHDFDVTGLSSDLVCRQLESLSENKQFIRIVNGQQYFAPLLSINPSPRAISIMNQIPEGDLFAYLCNWVLRPVPSVMTAVRNFRERYLQRNYVIGMEITLESPLSEYGTMPAPQQDMFFEEASSASFRALDDLSDKSAGGGVVILVVTDDEAALRQRLNYIQQGGGEGLGAAGVLAITGPKGFGTTKLLTELQMMWLLGESDMCIVSPASAMGVFGHARTSKAPIVVVDGANAHQSTSSQPCLAHIERDVQATACYDTSMLDVISFDPSVPCVSPAAATATAAPAATAPAGNGRELRRSVQYEQQFM